MNPAHPLFSTRSLRRGNALLIVIVVAVLAVVAVAALAYYLARHSESEATGQLTAKVVRDDFVHDVVEAGEVESSDNTEVKCEVKSRNSAGTTILEVIPEGSLVKEGDWLVTLDSSSLVIEKQQEDIVLNNKKASRDQSKNLLIAAISGLKEYIGQEEFDDRYHDELVKDLQEKLGDDAEDLLTAIQTSAAGGTKQGTFHVEEQGYQAELFLAEEDLRTAEQFVRYSESLAAKGYFTQTQLKSYEFAVEKAHKARDAAQTKLDVLRVHTKRKTEKTLRGDIYNALAVFSSELSSVRTQQERVDEIEAQIAKCKIFAPTAGQVVYANERDRRGNADFVVEEGATVRENQAIIRLPNSDRMQVEAKISESKISLIREGMQATVNIDAFDNMTLEGVVTHVNQYPEPTNWFSSTVKEYQTEIQILNPPEELKSGLTAKVRIHAQFLPDVKQVPIQAVYRHGGKYYCFVEDGRTWRPQVVELGASNEKHVVIKSGLDEKKDVVAMDPASLLEDVDLPPLPKSGEEKTAAGSEALASKYLVPQDAQKPPRKDRPASPQSGPGGGRNPAEIAAMIFTRNDANSDGKLTADEMPERFGGSFTETDANGDGGIDRAELIAAMAKRASGGPGAGPPGGRGPGAGGRGRGPSGAGE